MLLLAGCADADLGARVASAEAELALVKAERDGLAEQLDACRMDSTESYPHALRLLEQATGQVNAWEPEAARDTIAEMDRLYPCSAPTRDSRSLEKRLNAIGKAPDALTVEFWFADAGVMGDTNVLLFFEEWCPFCRTELPLLQARSEAMPDVQFLGFTQITRTSTEAAVRGLLETHEVDFPVAKESGELFEYYGGEGFPMIVVLVDDAVVWVGHPADMDWARIATSPPE